MKPLWRQTLPRFLSIVCDLEQTNQLNLLPDKDLVDLCPHIEPYQVPKSQILGFLAIISNLNSIVYLLALTSLCRKCLSV